jgi:hypothetical protein
MSNAGVGHPLHGLAARGLARRCDRDDVLFAIDDESGRVAVVHLVWQGRQRPPYPSATFFENIAVWWADGMRRDHDEYET